MVPRAPDLSSWLSGKAEDPAGTVRMRGPHGVRVHPLPSGSLKMWAVEKKAREEREGEEDEEQRKV